jgi:hypothetical protein
MNDPQVIVLGGGPVGLVLVLLLSRSGIRVTVPEQAATFAHEFRDKAARAIEKQRRPAIAATQRIQNILTGTMYALGPYATLKLATALIGVGTRVGWWPSCMKREADRLLWRNPRVRANHEPAGLDCNKSTMP